MTRTPGAQHGRALAAYATACLADARLASNGFPCAQVTPPPRPYSYTRRREALRPDGRRHFIFATRARDDIKASAPPAKPRWKRTPRQGFFLENIFTLASRQLKAPRDDVIVLITYMRTPVEVARLCRFSRTARRPARRAACINSESAGGRWHSSVNIFDDGSRR